MEADVLNSFHVHPIAKALCPHCYVLSAAA
jgi:hypothetical protein